MSAVLPEVLAEPDHQHVTQAGVLSELRFILPVLLPAIVRRQVRWALAPHGNTAAAVRLWPRLVITNVHPVISIVVSSGRLRSKDCREAAGGEARSRGRYAHGMNSLYALAGALADPFAGYDSRVHGQLGYSRFLVDSITFHAVAEVGADVACEDYVEGTTANSAMIYAAREMVGVAWNLGETAALSGTIEAYENVLDFSDSRVLNTAALTAKLTGKLSLKFSHQLAFDNQTVMGTRVASVV